MLERSTGRIRMPDVSPACGRELIYFLYTGHVRPDVNLQELLAAAHKYQIDDLKDYCIQGLRAPISDSNWIDLLLLSDLYSAQDLKDEVLGFIRKNRGLLVKKKDWEKRLEGNRDLYWQIMETLCD
jgi:BTB/POZ domain